MKNKISIIILSVAILLTLTSCASHVSQSSYNNLQTQYNALQQQLTQTQNQLAQTQNETKEVENQLANTKTELVSTQQKLIDTQDTLTSTQNELSNTQSVLATTNKALADFQDKYHSPKDFNSLQELQDWVNQHHSATTYVFETAYKDALDIQDQAMADGYIISVSINDFGSVGPFAMVKLKAKVGNESYSWIPSDPTSIK